MTRSIPRTNLKDLDGILGLPDQAEIIWEPAHESNYSPAGSGAYRGVNRRHLGVCIHTPEEHWDNDELTPRLFARPNFGASTGYYADSDSDLYQMVHDADFAWAQGTKQHHAVEPRPAWFHKETMVSYNTCLDSIEVEGHAATLHERFYPGMPQFITVCAWVAFKSYQYGWPLDRQRVLGHGELSLTRTDPGPRFPWDDLMEQSYQLQQRHYLLPEAATSPPLSPFQPRSAPADETRVEFIGSGQGTRELAPDDGAQPAPLPVEGADPAEDAALARDILIAKIARHDEQIDSLSDEIGQLRRLNAEHRKHHAQFNDAGGPLGQQISRLQNEQQRLRLDHEEHAHVSGRAFDPDDEPPEA